ncbi:NAD(P)-binding protein [Sistotremastrum niveocremeum HHB9708]|uniref:NAD(P)-binding protein n=1 Tax=Sistotremastrum niveocremeum HHB9708 TaxID=1314777 RepID=A0A164UZ90_9AGAM|nr:NAD(P)-binding protein [Sistotremastrum niveocremeum HHB9708]
MITLAGQTIVVIGGSSGIGYAVAESSLQSLASHVIIASSSLDRVNAAVSRLESSAKSAGVSGKVSGRVLNVKDSAQIKSFFDEVGEIDHLVFSSGDALTLSGLKDLDLDSIRGVYDVRLWAPTICAQQAKIKKSGSIVLTTGSVVKKPSQGWSIVAGIAGSVDSLTRGLAVDLAPIRVNCIAPGFVNTEMWDTTPKDVLEKIFAEQSEKLLVKHVASPEEVAEAYLFAMKCAFITGETLHVNGGQTLV